MVEFPAGVVVSVPASLSLPGSCRVAVRLGSPAELEGARRAYGARLHEVVVAAAALADTDLLRSLQGLRVRVAPTTVRDLQAVENLARASGRHVVIGMAPDADLGRLLNYASSFDFLVHLEAGYAQPVEQLLLAALERFLRDPLQKAPIEPFGALARAQADGKGPSLWDTERERIGRFYHVTEEGTVTLSERWARSGVSFGLLEAGLEGIQSSEAHRRLQSFGRELLSGDRPCMLCEHTALCGGFLRAVDARSSCDAWKSVFARIRDEVDKVRELAKQYAAQQRQD